MILHTVNKSPFESNTFLECLELCDHGSSILLIEDGIYAAKKNTPSANKIESISGIKFYALSADIEARGLDENISSAITVVDDAGFVDLVTQHQSVSSWF